MQCNAMAAFMTTEIPLLPDSVKGVFPSKENHPAPGPPGLVCNPTAAEQSKTQQIERGFSLSHGHMVLWYAFRK